MNRTEFCVRLYFDGKALNFKTGTFQSMFIIPFHTDVDTAFENFEKLGDFYFKTLISAASN